MAKLGGILGALALVTAGSLSGLAVTAAAPMDGLVPWSADPCGLPDPVPATLADARMLVQDDAGSGRDAGDCAAEAVPLPDSGYHWGHLDPVGAAGLVDGDDWFVVDLGAVFGPDKPVMVTLTADLVGYYQEVFGLDDTSAPHMALQLTMHPPDGSAPALVTSCEGGTFLPHALTGPWRFHVERASVGGQPVCDAPEPWISPQGPVPTGQSYGLYIGCHPHCDDQDAGPGSWKEA